MSLSEVLLVYYSRTGITEKVASRLIEKMDCDFERIRDRREKNGGLDYGEAVRYAKEAIKTEIFTPDNDPGEYDITVVGTPIWVGSMPPSVKAYLQQHKKGINKLAIFTTSKASPHHKVLEDAGEILEREIRIAVNFKRENVLQGKYEDKLKDFVKKIDDTVK